MAKARKPKLCYHKRLKQWYIRLDGKTHYLGTDEAEAADRYDDLIRDWLRGREDQHRLTLDDLALLYIEHAEKHYVKDGQPTRLHNVRSSMRYLVDVAGRTRLRQFGPLRFKQVRERMLEAGLARTTINDHMAEIKRAVRWAVENELCSVETWQALLAVPGLKRGRSEAREPDPVKPVAEEHVNAVLPYLSRQVRDMIRIQLLTGQVSVKRRHFLCCNVTRCQSKSVTHGSVCSGRHRRSI